MNKKYLGFAFLCCILFASCSTDNDVALPYSNVRVGITRTDVKEPGKCTVLFTPEGEGVAGFAYAIGGDEYDMEAFISETMPSYSIVDSVGESSVVFEDLEDGVYTVYARAYDEAGKWGEASTMKVYMPDGYFVLESQYVTHESAGFTIKAPYSYYRFRYAFGKESDRDAFVRDEMEGTVYLEENFEITDNYFDLEPDTEYVMFAQGWDRSGAESPVIERKIKTFREGECPAVSFEVESLDIYRGVFKLVPNDKCGMIGAGIMDKGEYDGLINSGFLGNIMQMIDGWKDIASEGIVPSYKAVGETLVIDKKTPKMIHNVERELYVTVYDKDFNVCGVQHFEYKTPGIDPEAGTAVTEIEITDITSRGATYHYKNGEHVFGLFYETVDGAWLDDLMSGTLYHDTYLHEYLYNQGYYFSYGKGDVEYTEAGGEPGTRYYAAACPMNVNGPCKEGWGPLNIKEYKTL